MKSLLLQKTHALADAKALSTDLDQLTPVFNELAQQVDQAGYPDPYSFVRLPADLKQIKLVNDLAVEQLKRNPALAIVVGIGGSNLGAQAVYQALFPSHGPQVPLYFADTVDVETIGVILARAGQALKEGKNILVIGISKSGSTTETIANFECFLALLMAYRPKNYQQSVVVISDRGSLFWQLAMQKGFELLEIPAPIGGRFSVLSPAGLFPLAIAGVDIEQLGKGAYAITADCIAAHENNPAFVMASALAYHYAKGIRIHDLFVFSTVLEGLGKWQRQLLGESLGKRSEDGVPVGITPTVSVGSTDLHSVGQLYLGGPNARVTTFVWVEHEHYSIAVPDIPEFDLLVPHLQKKSLHEIMNAIFAGTQKAYEDNACAYMSIIMPEKNAFYIGQFLQMQMIATIYLGALLKVNTFDQPQVELYKRNTRKILAHE